MFSHSGATDQRPVGLFSLSRPAAVGVENVFPFHLPLLRIVCKSGLLTFEDKVTEKGWRDVYNDHFDWLRDNGGTPSVSTGPSVDHTKGTAAGELADDALDGYGGGSQ